MVYMWWIVEWIVVGFGRLPVVYFHNRNTDKVYSALSLQVWHFFRLEKKWYMAAVQLA